jgi:hypothetical protein
MKSKTAGVDETPADDATDMNNPKDQLRNVQR